MLLTLLLATSLLNLGDQALAAGELEGAIKAYRAHLEAEPESYRARLGLARAQAYAGRWEEAVALYSELLDDNPDDPDARLGRGRVRAWMGQWEAAEADLRPVTENHPRYTDAWHALGDLLLWSGRWREALDAYARWEALAPNDPQPRLARFRAHREGRRFSRARADLADAEALGADPEVVAQGRTSLDRLAWRGWELRLRYDFIAFARPRSDWHTAQTTLQYDFEGGALALDATRAYRFESQEHALGLEAYVDLWHRAYANPRAQFGLESRVLPIADLRASLHQGLAERWEVSASYRLLAFSAASAHLAGAGLAWHLGDWMLRQQALLVVKGGELGFAFDALVRFHYGTVDDRIELQVGGGRDLVTLTADRLDRRRTFFARLEVQHFLGRRFGFLVGFSVHDDAEVPTGWGVSGGLVLRWQ